MTKKEVIFLQESLNKILKINLTSDGNYGNLTRSAVRSFQEMVGLKNDGIAGPLTIEKINNYNIEIKIAPDIAPRKDYSLNQVIIDVADQYIGLSEVKSNAIWDKASTKEKDTEINNKLIKKMTEARWQEGWAYCAAYVEAVWREAYLLYGISKDSKVFSEISSLLTPSVMLSFNNFNAIGKISKIPEKGAIFFMQSGSSGNGHAGIVESFDGKFIYTREANTSANAGTIEADRNGDGIYSKKRTYSLIKSNRLWIRGFLNPYLK